MKKLIKKITMVALLANIILLGAVNYKTTNTDQGVKAETFSVKAASGQYAKIIELQSALGIPQTGQWDTLTIAKVASLTPLSTSNSYPREVTRWIQRRLGINADGWYGNQTASAVYNWQASHQLGRDGISGIETIQSLALA